MNRKRFYVYAIKVDGIVRYIGKGTNGRMRFHYTVALPMIANGSKRYRSRFYTKLYDAWSKGATITAAVVADGLTEKQANKGERAVIADYRARKPGQLWNVQPGGDNGMAELWSDPEWKTKQSALIKLSLTTPRIRARRSAQASRRWSDPRELANYAAKMDRQRADPKYSASITMGLKLAWKDSEKRAAMLSNREWTAARRKRRSALSTTYWSDPKNRVRQSKAFSRYWTPSNRARKSTTTARLWRNPEYRARNLAARKKRRHS